MPIIAAFPILNWSDVAVFFVAEEGLVVRAADRPRFRARSALLTPTAFESLRDVIEPRLDDLTVFLCDLPLLRDHAGFNTR